MHTKEKKTNRRKTNTLGIRFTQNLKLIKEKLSFYHLIIHIFKFNVEAEDVVPRVSKYPGVVVERFRRYAQRIRRTSYITRRINDIESTRHDGTTVLLADATARHRTRRSIEDRGGVRVRDR